MARSAHTAFSSAVSALVQSKLAADPGCPTTVRRRTERAARERVVRIISASSKGFGWWENHLGGYRLPAGSLKLEQA